MRLGLDLDGCTYPWEETARKMLEKRLECKLAPSEFFNHLAHQVPEADWRWLWREGLGELFGQLIAYPGAPSAMRKLAAKTDLVVITSRPRQVAHLTLGWLAHWRVNPREVHILGPNSSKAAIAPCRIYVEDKVSHVNELIDHHRSSYVLMPNRPWNNGRDGDLLLTSSKRVVRFDTWRQALAEVDERVKLAREEDALY